MKWSRLKAWGGFLLAALLCSPVWGSIPPQPGTINYVEGQASIDGKTLTSKSVGSATLAAGESLSTQDGRAEILLTPGVFFRVAEHSSVQMIAPGLADTVLAVEKGRAMVEVAEIHHENNIRIREGNASVRLLKRGLYEFDADHQQVRVFDGKAAVQADDHRVDLKGGRLLALNTTGRLKARKFDKKAAGEDDFYRWASLRSAYLAEANVDAARTYVAGGGWSPGIWYGSGWYWNPWFSAYTFIPANGFFYDPFGWGFYSPWMVYSAPYLNYGFGRYYHFGPRYHPPVDRGARGLGLASRPVSPRVGGVNGFSRGGAFASPRAGFGQEGGFRRGGSFGARGFGGGGFHGGRR